MSFGMIFSIILIILFVSFAVWGITKLLNIQEKVGVEKFPDELQEDINDIWGSSHGEQKKSYELPKKVGSVCFVDEEYPENLFLKEKKEGGIEKEIGRYEIKHLDIEKTTQEKEEICIQNEGEINLKLIKERNNPNITIVENG